MEQRTIGARIAALRKDRGMTQQQLADLLSVSNKAVSRWEREESAPDLSLVPMIADIFGITCDELLRGEVQTVRPEPEPAIITPAPKNLRIYTTLSCGLILLGLLAALICYLGIGWRFGVLGFCLELAFCLAAGVCQTIGTLNAPEDLHSKKNTAANVAILALTFLSGSALIMNSSLDMEEILLLGIPLASAVFMAGLLLKWFLICPVSDEKTPQPAQFPCRQYDHGAHYYHNLRIFFQRHNWWSGGADLRPDPDTSGNFLSPLHLSVR